MRLLRLSATLTILVTWLFILPIPSLAAPLQDALFSEFGRTFDNIIFDVRGSRGGNGDVAAGYLTIMAFLNEHHLPSQITVLVDDQSRRIIETMARGNREFWSQVKVHTISSLPESQHFDLYLSLASPSGAFRFSQEMNVLENPTARSLEKKINLKHNAVMLTQTVLGNTENPFYTNSNPILRIGGTHFSMSPAGLAEGESGIYFDYVAAHLRGKDESYVREFTLSSLSLVDDLRTHETLSELLSGQKLAGAKKGLVYIHSVGTSAQFNGYLDGLLKNSSESYCLITPSALIGGNVSSRVQVLGLGETLPKDAEPGKIYIVKVPPLPHPTFVGLVSYSMKNGVPPLGDGDGFLSAAIALGEPFAMTKIEWNEKNVDQVAYRLSQILTNKMAADGKTPSEISQRTSTVHKVFQYNLLSKVLELQSYREVFFELRKTIPNLVERIATAAIAARHATDSGGCGSTCEGILDPVLRQSLQKGGIKTVLYDPQKTIYPTAIKQPASCGSKMSHSK